MNTLLRFSQMWRRLSPESLDVLLRFKFFRKLALNRGEKQLFQTFVVANKDQLPVKIQEMRCVALTNLLHTVNRAISDGRISNAVRKAILKNFVSGLLIGEKDRIMPFGDIYGVKPPNFLTISPTKMCNLNCKGCYASSSSKNAETLSYSVFNWILRQKKKEWNSSFTVISGGEPLMYSSEGKNLIDILSENQDQYFMMYTNGNLIDRNMAQKIAKVGNLTPAISVEGLEEETDERRGRGVFRKIDGAMDALKEFGVPFGVSMTATRYNAERILSDEVLDYYFQEKGAIYGWIFQYMPIGRSYTVDLMITPEQRQWMLEKELEMIYEKNLFLIDFWNGGAMSLGCISAGRPGGYFYIDWNGNISPCVFFPYAVDNIYNIHDKNKTLTDILNTDYFKALRSWQRNYMDDGGKVKNLFMPCPIRDHYHVAHKTIQNFSAEPIDINAARALEDGEYQRKMIEYDREVARRLDPLWDEKIYSVSRQKTSKKKIK